MTDLESPRKNNDCYFYYYSTCTKGDNCTFRHEPSALGCETTCSFWKEGKCINVRCNFRHMELRKNRKTIPCYWESQPSGCKKQHCPFMHVNKKDGDDNDNLSDENDDICMKSKKDDFTAPVVDPIVVNFEEESDNESSTPTQSSHHKTHQTLQLDQQQVIDHSNAQTRNLLSGKARSVVGFGSSTVEVKTLEEIKLDRIQAESAAYYSYSDELTPKTEETDASNGRRNIFQRLQPLVNLEKAKVNINDVQVLTLDEIRRRKRKIIEPLEKPVEEQKDLIINKKQKTIVEDPSRKPKNKKTVIDTIHQDNTTEFKIKTLAEIKAEKQAKLQLKRKLQDDSQTQKEEEPSMASKRVKIIFRKENELDEQEVSSTSKTDDTGLGLGLESELSNPHNKQLEPQQHQQLAETKVKCVVAPVQRHIDVDVAEVEDKSIKSKKIMMPNDKALSLPSQSIPNVDADINIEKGNSCLNDHEESKLDEFLLDDDDDEVIDDETLTLKAEDDILNDIDNLLNE